MKTFWGAVVAVVIAVSLTGCGVAAVAGPAGAHRTGVAVERTWTPAPAAPEVVPVEAAAEAEPAPVETEALGEEASAAAEVVAAPEAAPSPVAPPVDVAPAVGAAPSLSPFDEWMSNPTFTCEGGQAPGWLNEQGIPTGCVAN